VITREIESWLRLRMPRPLEATLCAGRERIRSAGYEPHRLQLNQRRWCESGSGRRLAVGPRAIGPVVMAAARTRREVA